MAKARKANMQNYSLPAVLDLLGAQALKNDLLEHFNGDGDLLVNGADVERISTPCIEVMIAAAGSFGRADRKFLVQSPSACFEDAMKTLGLTDYLSRWRQA